MWKQTPGRKALDMADQTNATGDETSSTSVDTEFSSGQVSPDLEATVQEKLNDTFGGVRDEILEDEAPVADNQDAADSGKKTVPVKAHQRRVKPRSSRGGDGTGYEEDTQDPIHVEEEDINIDKPASEAAQREDPLAPTTDVSAEEKMPVHLIDAARRRGWTDDRISRFVDQAPEIAKETFEQLHQDANNLSQRYSELGRNLLHSDQSVTQDPGQVSLPGSQQPAPIVSQDPNQVTTTQQPGQPLLPDFSFPKSVFDEVSEDFRKGVLDRVEAHMTNVNHVINNMVSSHDKFIVERRNEILYQQIDTFFNNCEGFETLYDSGKSRVDLSDAAGEARVRVVQEADAIRAGAFAQNRNLSVQESLEMAHNLRTSQHQRETVRREIQGELRKRETKVTVRPTHIGKDDVDSTDPIAKATRTAAKKFHAMSSV